MKTKMNVVIAALAALVLVAGGCKKQGASADPAKDLSQSMFSKEQHGQMIETIVQMGQSMARAQPSGDANKKAVDPAELEKDLRNSFSYDYFIDLNKATLKKNFTDAQLADLAKFFSTEAGKKWVKVTPNIIQETMGQVRTDFSTKMNKVMGIESPEKEGKPGEGGEKDKAESAKPSSEKDKGDAHADAHAGHAHAGHAHADSAAKPTTEAGKPVAAAPKK